MEPVKVDELIHILGLAREDAKKMVAARSRRLSHGDTNDRCYDPGTVVGNAPFLDIEGRNSS
jgi:hypothetical protein